MPDALRRTGILCRLCQTRRILRRGLESDLPIVFALAHGATKEPFYYGDWISKPGIAICSCNDGLRPVIFKQEATNEESQINYILVQD